MAQSRTARYNPETKKITIEIDATNEVLSKTGKSLVIYRTPSYWEDLPDSDYQFTICVIKKIQKVE